MTAAGVFSAHDAFSEVEAPRDLPREAPLAAPCCCTITRLVAVTHSYT